MKKTLYLSLIWLALVASFSSCKKDSTSSNNSSAICLSANTSDTVYTGESLEFDICNLNNSARYLWNFGDGATAATSPWAHHSYSAAATYAASVTENTGNGSNTRNFSVYVTTPPALGYWNFLGDHTYPIATCDTSQLQLVAMSGVTPHAAPRGIFAITFSQYPTVSGTYGIANPSTGSTGVTVNAIIYENGGSVDYVSTGKFPVPASVNVTVTNGKISITGADIELKATLTGSYQYVYFTMTQQ